MSGTRLLPAALALAVVASALGVVYTSHLARRLYGELVRLERARDALEVEWGRLQLEQSTWATHARIERLARERLHMRMPRPEEIVVVRP